MKNVLCSFVIALLLGSASVVAEPAPHRVHVELDPLPFVLGGYGGQLGYRGAALPHWRIAVASFSLEVPDLVAELGGNDGFHLDVRPSFASYLLYYVSDARGGWLVGGSVRYLRQTYTHDDAPGQEARVGQLSVELIGGYKWHPFARGWARGLFAQPWLTVARTLADRGEAVVGGLEYDAMPLDLFFTVNLGWELELGG